jgi:hypothetical protein
MGILCVGSAKRKGMGTITITFLIMLLPMVFKIHNLLFNMIDLFVGILLNEPCFATIVVAFLPFGLPWLFLVVTIMLFSIIEISMILMILTMVPSVVFSVIASLVFP